MVFIETGRISPNRVDSCGTLRTEKLLCFFAMSAHCSGGAPVPIGPAAEPRQTVKENGLRGIAGQNWFRRAAVDARRAGIAPKRLAAKHPDCTRRFI